MFTLAFESQVFLEGGNLVKATFNGSNRAIVWGNRIPIRLWPEQLGASSLKLQQPLWRQKSQYPNYQYQQAFLVNMAAEQFWKTSKLLEDLHAPSSPPNKIPQISSTPPVDPKDRPLQTCLPLPPNLVLYPRPQLQQALPVNSKATATREAGRLSVEPSVLLDPTLKSHPQMYSRHYGITSLHWLSLFQGDKINRSWMNTLVSCLLWNQTDS